MYFPNAVTTDEIQDVLGAMTASAKAVAEFGLMMGSASIAEPLSGLAGIATGNIDNIAKVQDALTYQPRTKAGQVAMKSIAKDVSNLANETGLNHLSGYWRDRVVPALQDNLGVISGSVLAAGGLGLITAMSEFVPGSRATRAMPFPQEGAIKRVFHGSADDIQGFDPSMRGSSTKARSAKEAFWFADNPDVAAGYAKRAAEDAPVQKLIDDSYAAERAGDFDKANDLMAEAERLDLSGELVGGGGQNIIPVDIDDADLLEIDMDGAFYDPDDTPLTDIIQQAKSEGKRGVKIKNFVDNADYGSDLAATHYGVFNPEDIKPAYRPKITDLPMDSASRMARAEEMGFNQTMYRGLSEPFDEAKTSHLTWTTDNPEYASAYAYGGADKSNIDQGSNVMKLQVKSQSPFDFGYRSQFTEVKYDDMLDRLKRGASEALNRGDITRDKGLDILDKIEDMRDAAPDVNDMKPVFSWWNDKPEMVDVLKDLGHDSLIAKEGIDDNISTLAIFGGDQMRSVNAAFDPAKRSSSNLLAGTAAATPIAAALLSMQPDDNTQ